MSAQQEQQNKVTVTLICNPQKDEITMLSVDFGRESQKITFFNPNKILLKDLKNLKPGNALLGVKECDPDEIHPSPDSLRPSCQNGWSITYDQEHGKYFMSSSFYDRSSGQANEYGVATSLCLPTEEFEAACGVIIQFLETYRSLSYGKRLDGIRMKAREIDLDCAVEYPKGGRVGGRTDMCVISVKC